MAQYHLILKVSGAMSSENFHCVYHSLPALFSSAQLSSAQPPPPFISVLIREEQQNNILFHSWFNLKPPTSSTKASPLSNSARTRIVRHQHSLLGSSKPRWRSSLCCSFSCLLHPKIPLSLESLRRPRALPSRHRYPPPP